MKNERPSPWEDKGGKGWDSGRPGQSTQGHLMVAGMPPARSIWPDCFPPSECPTPTRVLGESLWCKPSSLVSSGSREQPEGGCCMTHTTEAAHGHALAQRNSAQRQPPCLLGRKSRPAPHCSVLTALVSLSSPSLLLLTLSSYL